jgi:hypothetical protein
MPDRQPTDWTEAQHNQDTSSEMDSERKKASYP